MKVKLFDHVDFDGISTAIVGKSFFGDNVDIEYCGYHDVCQKFNDFWFSEDVYNYDKVFMVDLSLTDDFKLVDDVDRYIEQNDKLPKFKMIDHHKTALWMNKYDWCHVEVGENENLECGASLFFKYLNQNGFKLLNPQEFPRLCELIELTRKYDTWLWHNYYNDAMPKKWNNLLYIMGRERFIKETLHKIKIDSLSFTYTDNLLLELEQEKIDRYIESKNKSMIRKSWAGYNIGIVFAESFISELGNTLCELNDDIDLAFIINIDRSVSMRTVKDNVDLSELAKSMGGGGHSMASGFGITEDVKDNIIQKILNNKKIKGGIKCLNLLKNYLQKKL